MRTKYNDALPSAITNQKKNQYIEDVVQKIPELRTLVKVTFNKWEVRKTLSANLYFQQNAETK